MSGASAGMTQGLISEGRNYLKVVHSHAWCLDQNDLKTGTACRGPCVCLLHVTLLPHRQPRGSQTSYLLAPGSRLTRLACLWWPRLRSHLGSLPLYFTGYKKSQAHPDSRTRRIRPRLLIGECQGSGRTRETGDTAGVIFGKYSLPQHRTSSI